MDNGTALIVAAAVFATVQACGMLILWASVRDSIERWTENISLWVRTQRIHDADMQTQREKMYWRMVSYVLKNGKGHGGPDGPGDQPESAT